MTLPTPSLTVTAPPRSGSEDGSSHISVPRQCFDCGHHVTPTSEGYCPNCTGPFRDAVAGQKTFRLASPSSGPPAPPVGQVFLKLAIVFIVWPVFGQILTFGMALLLTPILWLMPETAQAAAMPAVQWMTFLIGWSCAAVVAYKLWPKTDAPTIY